MWIRASGVSTKGMWTIERSTWPVFLCILVSPYAVLKFSRASCCFFQNLAHWKADHDCKDLSRARVSIHGHYFRSRLALKLSFGAFESWGRQLSHAPNEGLRANLDLKLCPKVWKKIDKISRSPRASTHLIFLSRQFDTCRQIKLESLLKKMIRASSSTWGFWRQS